MSTSSLDRSADALLQQKASQFSQYERLDADVQQQFRSTRSAVQQVKQCSADSLRVDEDLKDIVEGNRRLESTLQQQSLRSAVLLAAVQQSTTKVNTVVEELKSDRQWNGLCPRLLRVIQGLRERSSCLSAFTEALPQAEQLSHILTLAVASQRQAVMEHAAVELCRLTRCKKGTILSQAAELKGHLAEAEAAVAHKTEALAELMTQITAAEKALTATTAESERTAENARRLEDEMSRLVLQITDAQATEAAATHSITVTEHNTALIQEKLDVGRMAVEAMRSLAKEYQDAASAFLAAEQDNVEQFRSKQIEEQNSIVSAQAAIVQRQEAIKLFCQDLQRLLPILQHYEATDLEMERSHAAANAETEAALAHLEAVKQSAQNAQQERHLAEQRRVMEDESTARDSIEKDWSLNHLPDLQRAELAARATAEAATKIREAAEQAAELQRREEAVRRAEAEHAARSAQHVSQYLDEQMEIYRPTVSHKPKPTVAPRPAATRAPPPRFHEVRASSLSSEWSAMDLGEAMTSSHHPPTSTAIVNGGCHGSAMETPSPLPRPPTRFQRHPLGPTLMPRPVNTHSQLSGLAGRVAAQPTHLGAQPPASSGTNRLQPKVNRRADTENKNQGTAKKKGGAPLPQASASDEFDVFAI